MKKGFRIIAAICIISLAGFSSVFSQCGHAVFAGQTTGLDYTYSDEQIIGNQIGDSLFIDLNGDANNDLLFVSAYIVMGNALNSNNKVKLLHNKIELFTDTVYPAAMVYYDSISDCLNWRQFNGNDLLLAVIAIEPAYLVYGNFMNKSGYLGIRMLNPNDTLYGWVQINSFVTEQYANMTVIDYAIEDEITNVDNFKSLHETELYPNPANDVVYVKAQENSLITVTNSTGQVISNTNSSDIQTVVSFSDYPAGVYVFRICSKNGCEFFRIIKSED